MLESPGTESPKPAMPTRAILHHTPLFAIEAVAVDTETTGLDPRSARLLEVGAVVIRGSMLQEETAFRRLVASPEPIPPPRPLPCTGSRTAILWTLQDSPKSTLN
jgi:hypothetical protein